MPAGITPVPGHRNSWPGSFIGRQIAFFRVRHLDTKNGDGYFDYDNFSVAVRIIQTQAEVIWVGVPTIRDNWGSFVVAVSYDTANNAGDGPTAKTIEYLLQQWDGDALFTRVYAVGQDWYEENDYLNYIDGNFDQTNGATPVVYGHGSVEQDEFNVQWYNY
jgi:hypothetical protein